MSRRTVAIAASVALTVVTAVGVLLFGIVRPPEVPGLDEADRRLPTRVAALDADREEGCVIVVAPDGARSAGYCAGHGAVSLRVDEDGRLLLAEYDGGGPATSILDPRTGALVSRESRSPGRLEPESGPPPDQQRGTVIVDEVDGRLEIAFLPPGDDGGGSGPSRADGGEELLGSLPAVRGYRLHPTGSWSPDGRWHLLTDSQDRVLAVERGTRGVVLVGGQLRQPVWVPG